MKITQHLWGLFSTMILGNAAERIIFPLFALVFFDLHSQLLPENTSQAIRTYWYGWCMALPSIGNLIGAPLLSSVSDRYGRKKILIISLLGTAIAGIFTSAAILTTNLYFFMFGVFFLGLFSRTNPIAQAAIGEITHEPNKLIIMGYLQSTIAFGAFLGPIIGGYCAQLYFDTINFSAAFILSTLLSVAGSLLCFFFFKETLTSPQSSLSSISLVFSSFTLLKKRSALPLAIILACGQVTWSLYYQYAPAILKINNNMSAQALGIFVGFMALWVTLGSSLGIYLLRRWFSLLSCLNIGLSMQLIGGLLFILAMMTHWGWLTWFSAAPMAIGDVVVFGALSTAYSNYFPNQQGQAMGACYLNASLIWTFTGLIGGYLMAASSLLPLIISPISTIFAFKIIFKAKKHALL